VRFFDGRSAYFSLAHPKHVPLLNAVLLFQKVMSVLSKIFAVFLLIFAMASWAQAAPAADGGRQVWGISMDNDLFVPLASSDRDFTGGLALTWSAGPGANTNWFLDGLLAHADRALAGNAVARPPATTSAEFGLYGFTPDDIEQTQVIANDRPYASLVYISASRVYPLAKGNSISTGLTLGVLGSDLVGDVQNELHRWLGNDVAQGWDNQISDGGELTARYHIAHHHYWDRDPGDARFKTTVFSSIGYLAEVGIAISTRRGLINSPDHRFNPELIAYGERLNEITTTPYRGRESYLWGGISLKARLYNAFLQGQFRDSVHSLNQDDLRPLIAEAWLGYTFTFGEHYRASYVLRAQSSELNGGKGDRGHVWGGIVLSRSL